MTKINYDAIAFKNKDIDKFSKKFGNSDPVKGAGPQNTSYYGPDYTKGKQSNFAGYDRKREPVIPETKSTVKTATTEVSTARKAAPVQNKTMLEKRMAKYGIEPTAPVKGRSASMQREIDRNKIKMAKDRIKAEKLQERNANPTKFDTFVMKTLHKGKYDKGGKKNMDMGGDKRKICVDKTGQKTQDAECKISMAGKFKQAFKKQKPAQNTMWTITK